MKATTIFAQIVFCVFFIPSSSNAEQGKISANFVAESVAWQVHWDNVAGIHSKAPSELILKIHERSEAWIGGLDWVISFADWEGQSLPNYVQRLSLLGDDRKSAMLPFASLAPVTAKLPAYAKSFRRISELQPDVQKKLLLAFMHEACNAETMAYYKDAAGKTPAQIRFWIAPVDLDFPVMLYFVEGVPYIGKVYFHGHSLEPLYSEFNYIGDSGNESHRQGLKLMGGIKTEGDLFKLENGRLVLLHAE